MNNIDKNDMIVALSTPYGKSAIAAIRVSGAGCIEKVGKFLSRPLIIYQLKYNEFIDGDFRERLTVTYYKAPASYTGEDMVELYPHGNMTICDRIIKALVGAGMRVAERGEFTKRAFLNGKIDLMQCEALADIIDAQTDEQLFYGNKRYDNGFKALSEVQHILKTALSTVEAVLHYGDELEENEIDEGLVNDVYHAIALVKDKLKGEIDGYAGGRIVNDGFKIALIGAPNVGKSTLLNALIGKERAIVTPVAGTTRDIVDGEYVYNGKKFVVIDTAGLTQTDDLVEKIGVERAKEAAGNADIAVIMSADGYPDVIPDELPELTVEVKNKCDGIKDVGTEYKKAVNGKKLEISAKNGINITAIKQMLYDLCPNATGAICNHRQYECVLNCYEACLAAERESKKAQNLEIVAAAMYDAYSAIEELYGEKADESVISTVFERFCVGK